MDNTAKFSFFILKFDNYKTKNIIKTFIISISIYNVIYHLSVLKEETGIPFTPNKSPLA